VRAGSRPDALHLEFIPGLAAADAIEAGQASALLHSMGGMLRRIQEVDPRRFGRSSSAGVVSHGDFAPYNAIVSEAGDVAAIVDWEAADVRSPLTDLAWCEWQFERMCPRHAYALPNLFDGYGERPPRAALDEALSARLNELAIGRAPSWSPGEAERHRVEFDDRDQAAAFMGAVSRAVSAPLRAGPLAAPSELWAVVEGDGVHAYLNRTAMEIAMSVFQAAGGEISPLPPNATLVFLAGHVAPLGRDDVMSLL
jgi:hypothetical protein